MSKFKQWFNDTRREVALVIVLIATYVFMDAKGKNTQKFFDKFLTVMEKVGGIEEGGIKS
jgi:preprotein translocase subunit SecE